MKRPTYEELQKRMAELEQLASNKIDHQAMHFETIDLGRIVPMAAPIEQRIEAMTQAGLALWNRKKLKSIPPVVKVRGKRTVASLLIEDRE